MTIPGEKSWFKKDMKMSIFHKVIKILNKKNI